MYQFILNMWVMGKADEVFVNYQVTRGRITQEEADMIFATPQTGL